MSSAPPPSAAVALGRRYPKCIATISAGFEKGDFLVREEKGQRVYFDFFEEAFNYIAAKGYSRMPRGEEGEWMDLMVSERAEAPRGAERRGARARARAWARRRLQWMCGGLASADDRRSSVPSHHSPRVCCVLPTPLSSQESVHASVKGGMKYNTGRLLMVLQKPLLPQRLGGDGAGGYDDVARYAEEPDMGDGQMLPMP